MKKFLYFCIPAALIAVAAMAADHVNRARNGILSTGGSTDYNGHTAIVTYDSSTNEYSWETITATVSAAATASTNTFGTAFIGTPVVVKGMLSGANGSQISNTWSVGATVTTTGLIVTGLSTNAATGVNSLPIMVYGYKRTGVFE